MLGILKRRLARLRQPQPVAARAQPEMLPAVEQADAVNSVPDWSRLRSPVREQDLRLSPLAEQWLAGRLPGAAPKALAKTYPRIVNRLALCWSDPELTVRVLDSLLVDKRGGRKGFARAIDHELRSLHAEALRLVSRRVAVARTLHRRQTG